MVLSAHAHAFICAARRLREDARKKTRARKVVASLSRHIHGGSSGVDPAASRHASARAGAV